MSLTALGLAALVGAAVYTGTLLDNGTDERPSAVVTQDASGTDAPSSTSERDAPTASDPVSAAAADGAEDPATPAAIPLGTELATPNFGLKIRTVKVVDEVPTLDGPPLRAEPGSKLVLFNATFRVIGPRGVDLSCSRLDMFIKGYDDQGSEMSDLFAEPNLAGNPECNAKLLTGQSSSWNFAYKIVAGHEPGYLEVIDTNTDGDDHWSEPVDMLLR